MSYASTLRWRTVNKAHYTEVRRKWQKGYKKKLRIKRRALRLEVLSHYSGTNPPQCVNPFGEHKEPYTTLEALTIDHVNGGGSKERKNSWKVGIRFYMWLKKNGYPKGYQTLCMNCQFIKRTRNEEWRPYATI
jgi:hypothetical protein